MAINFFKPGHRPDYTLLTTVAVLVVFGLVMLVSASSELGGKIYGDSYYYVKHQLLYGVLPGIVFFFIAAKLHYRVYQKLAFALLLLNLFGLLLVFSDLGYRAGGAGRWLRIGSLTFQPSEILKISFVVYLAAWLGNMRANRVRNFGEGFVPFLLICALVGGLLVLQPATSTVVILLGAGFMMYFLSGAKMRYIALMILGGTVVFGGLIYFTPYRFDRIKAFLNKETDALGAGYQLNEALTAIGSGGLWGIGFGQSPVKSGRLPAAVNDSIFAIIASELGFVGAGALLALLGFLAFRLLWIAKNLRDVFGRLVLVGFATIVAFQAFVNIGAMTGLLPLTGVPLPFISYGGTALVVFLTMMGIAVNISKYT